MLLFIHWQLCTLAYVDVLDCFLHTIDLVGSHFKTLSKFITLWISLSKDTITLAEHSSYPCSQARSPCWEWGYTVAMSMSYCVTRQWRMQMGGDQAVYWGTNWWRWLRSSVKACSCLEGNGLLAAVWSVTSVVTEDIPDDVRDVAQSWPESLLDIHTMNCMLFVQRGVAIQVGLDYFNDQLTSIARSILWIFLKALGFVITQSSGDETYLTSSLDQTFSLFKIIVWTRQHSIGLCQWNIIRSKIFIPQRKHESEKGWNHPPSSLNFLCLTPGI